MIPEIRRFKNDTILYLRDSFVLVFFCRKPLAEAAAPFAAAFQRWQEVTPAEAKKWASVGASSTTFKEMSPQRLKAAERELKAAGKDLAGFVLGGPEQYNSEYRFDTTLHKKLEGEETAFIEMRFPRAPSTPEEVKAFVALAKSFAELLPYSSGYASPALVCGVDSQRMPYGREAPALSFRHPGFDITHSSSTAWDVGDKVRGAYWLTFLGPAALKELGGEPGLRKKLDAKIGIERAGEGVLIQAGPKPEVGDVNRNERLPLVREVAKALEPVTLFTGKSLNNDFTDPADIPRWLRRHLD